MADDQNDDFFEGLAGKSSKSQQAKIIREVMIERHEAAQDFDQLKPEPMSDAQQAKYDAMRKKLIDQGVLKEPKINNPVGVKKFNLLTWLREAFTFNKMEFVSASVVLLIGIALFNQDKAPMDAISPSSTLAQVLMTEDPASETSKLEQALKTANATVTTQQVNDTEWKLQVTAKDLGVIEEIKTILQENGLTLTSEPPYIISIKKE